MIEKKNNCDVSGLRPTCKAHKDCLYQNMTMRLYCTHMAAAMCLSMEAIRDAIGVETKAEIEKLKAEFSVSKCCGTCDSWRLSESGQYSGIEYVCGCAHSEEYDEATSVDSVCEVWQQRKAKAIKYIGQEG